MKDFVKSSHDGYWYYKETQWKYVLDCLCVALSMFSESDFKHDLYIAIDHCADEVSKILKNEY